jgi:7-alpha-hydroxysteroid dehydrogenase
MVFSVAEKSVIVTGAADGVGRAIARRYAEEGAFVIAADSDEEALQESISDLLAEGLQIHAFHGDLRQKLAAANLISSAIDHFERIDVLVNASRHVVSADPLELDEGSAEQMMEENVFASLRLSRLVARKMIAQDEDSAMETIGGSIVNVTSIAARCTLPEFLAYSMSSAALDQMTRSLAVALAKHRIRVNAVAIGSVMSATLKRKLQEQDDLREKLATVTPMGRIGSAAEAAEAALFLSSSGASFVTGQVVSVDGGRSIQDPLGIAAL